MTQGTGIPMTDESRPMALPPRSARSNLAASIAVSALLAIGPVLFGREAVAQTTGCGSSPNESTLMACHKAQVGREDRQIATLVKKLGQMADGEPAMKRLITASQAAWLKYRDAECKMRTFESSTGSAAQVYLHACFEDINAQRIRDLEERTRNP